MTAARQSFPILTSGKCVSGALIHRSRHAINAQKLWCLVVELLLSFAWKLDVWRLIIILELCSLRSRRSLSNGAPKIKHLTKEMRACRLTRIIDALRKLMSARCWRWLIEHTTGDLQIDWNATLGALQSFQILFSHSSPAVGVRFNLARFFAKKEMSRCRRKMETWAAPSSSLSRPFLWRFYDNKVREARKVINISEARFR